MKVLYGILLVALYEATAVSVQQHGSDVLQATSMMNETVTDPFVAADGCSDICHWQTSGPCQHPDVANNVCFNMTEWNWCPVGSIECGMRSSENGPQEYFVPKNRPAPAASSSASVSVTPAASSSASVSVTPVASSSVSVSVTPVTSSSVSVSVTPVASSSAAVSVTPVASSSAAVSVTPVASSSAAVSVTPVASASTSRPPAGHYLDLPIDGRLVQNTLALADFMMPQYNYSISFDMTVHEFDGRQCNIFLASATETGDRGGGATSNYPDSRVPKLDFSRNGFKFYNYAENPNCGSRGVDFNMPGSWDLNRKYQIEVRMLKTPGLDNHPTAEESHLIFVVDGAESVEHTSVCSWKKPFLRSQLWLSAGPCAAPVTIESFAINYMDRNGNPSNTWS